MPTAEPMVADLRAESDDLDAYFSVYKFAMYSGVQLPLLALLTSAPRSIRYLPSR